MGPELAKLLSVQRGHFRFESGHHGDLWLDLDQLFHRPAVLRPFVDELAVRLARHRVEAICGPFVGGALLAQLIAATLEVDFYFADPITYRLAHGLQQAMLNQRVAIVDDAINAGSAVRGTLDELRSAGAVPVVVGSLVVLGETGANFVAAEGLPLECLTTIPNQLWLPADCPFCAGGVPLEIGGPATAADPG